MLLTVAKLMSTLSLNCELWLEPISCLAFLKIYFGLTIYGSIANCRFLSRLISLWNSFLGTFIGAPFSSYLFVRDLDLLFISFACSVFGDVIEFFVEFRSMCCCWMVP